LEIIHLETGSVHYEYVIRCGKKKRRLRHTHTHTYTHTHTHTV